MMLKHVYSIQSSKLNKLITLCVSFTFKGKDIVMKKRNI